MRAKVVHRGDVWCLEFEEPYSILGMFLLADVGKSRQGGNYIRGKALSVLSEGHAPLMTGGNAYYVYMTKEWVLVESQYDEDAQPVVLSMQAFLRLLNYWKSITSISQKQAPPEDYPEFCYDDSAVSEISPEKVLGEFKQNQRDSDSNYPVRHRSRRRRRMP